MSDFSLTRRSALLAGGALPLASLASTASMATAGGHAAPKNAIHNTFALGDFQVSTLLVGTRTVEDIQSIFGMNVSKDEFAKVSEENFIPSDKAQFFFTPTVVQTGGETVLFDTGLSSDGTLAALSDAGINAEDIDVVVLTHMHGDHIGGLTDDAGNATFPNARYVTGQVEYDHWAAAGNDRFDGKVRPFADRMSFIGDGDSVVSGITGMAAFGYTPGHMAYMLDSGDEQVLLMADMANHYVWSLAYPEWEVRFDMDKEAAANTRKKVLAMVATDRIPLIGYHMPFPGMGFVEEVTSGRFRYVPTSYQMML